MIVEMKKFFVSQCVWAGCIVPPFPGHPVWNLRTKTPQNEQTTVPWHQDNAYFDPDALNVLLVTAWIPLIDANQENGCMQVWGIEYGVWSMEHGYQVWGALVLCE